MTASVLDRLLAGVTRDYTTGCLIWHRSLNSRGYGLIGVNGKVELAHRVAHELWVGPIGEGMQVDHVYAQGCRSKACIEPTHLEAVTGLENMRRTAAATKTHCIRNHELAGANLRINSRGTRSCAIVAARFTNRPAVHEGWRRSKCKWPVLRRAVSDGPASPRTTL